MIEHLTPLVGLIMGSTSDWPNLQNTHELLEQFHVPHEIKVVSAHRTPDWMADYAKSAEERGLKVIIAGAGGAAHLPGMVAAHTTLPVLGVPMESTAMKGIDSLYSMVQMPAGIPVGTLAIGKAGAKNAALLALSILATMDDTLAKALKTWRAEQNAIVMNKAPEGLENAQYVV